MRFSCAVLSGIRDFKFAGPKPSQTRKENARKLIRTIAHNHTVLKQIERGLGREASVAKDAKTATAKQ